MRPWRGDNRKRVPPRESIITFLQRARSQLAKGLRATSALLIILSPKTLGKIGLVPKLRA
jgi:hypothetical protein